MMTSWHDLVAETAGQIHLYTHTLDDGRILAYQPDEVVEAASTIKLPIMLAVLDQVQAGRLSLRTKFRPTRAQVGRHGTGIMANLHLDAPWSLYNLLIMMMALSDNVATNVLIDLLGPDTINAYIRTRLGLAHTRLLQPKFDFPHNYSVKTSPKVALTTARELVHTLELLFTNQLLDPFHTRLAQRILAQVRSSDAARRLPHRAIRTFGSKAGWIAFDASPLMVLNECGYIITKQDRVHLFAICTTLPKGQKNPYTADSTGRIEFARLAAALYEELES